MKKTIDYNDDLTEYGVPIIEESDTPFVHVKEEPTSKPGKYAVIL